MHLLKVIAKKLARRRRVKGTQRKVVSRPGRNFQGVTAVDLWRAKYRFKETPAAKAGQKHAAKRERKNRRWW